jgi:hypothetical protein
MLVPDGRTGQATHNFQDRTKLPRLHGADLYVARLGWKPHNSTHESATYCTGSHVDEEIDFTPRVATGSLHDELHNPQVQPRPHATTMNRAGDKHPSVLSSRPCYR